MCGRFSLNKTLEEILEKLPCFKAEGEHIPVLNIFPNSEISVAAAGSLFRLKWNFLTETLTLPLSNIRAEGIASKPCFRKYFYHHRCLIPADSFYEWKEEKDGSKTPYRFSMRDKSLFFMAGLFNPVNKTCAVVTTKPSFLVRSVHERMPAIINEKSFGVWLSEKADTEKILPLFSPFDSSLMSAEKAGPF